MSHPTVSVVVVSHRRPEALRRCLAGIAQLDYSVFEVVVVCDAPSRAEVRDPWVKTVIYDEGNIAAARNHGIAQSAGDVVAFIDDDAVPEPTWLSHLVGPFANPNVAASGGYVLGRNGISFQWTARLAFADGRTEPMPIPGTDPVILTGGPGRAIKTEGTNMAVRRSTLHTLGGFDEAYRFYLDETDLNMRLAAAGYATAIVPLAQVHHGFAASARRTDSRIPRDLTDIGASSAVFAAKYGDGGDIETARFADREAQRVRLLNMMVRGDLMPGDVRRLLAGFDAGWDAGATREAGRTVAFDTPPAFSPLPIRFHGHQMLVARFWKAQAARERARELVASGSRVTLLILSATALYHRVRFTVDGVWEQRGGQFGRARRDGPFFKWRSSAGRRREEERRLAQVRATR